MNAVRRIGSANSHLAVVALRVHALRGTFPGEDLDPELFLDSATLDALTALDAAIDQLEGLSKEYNDTRFS